MSAVLATVLVLAQTVTGETITVTATRSPSRLGETAASVVVIDQETLERSASPSVDDALRQIPGFSLFRRTGSRTANPTAQGVSLRGIGPSGASRALVLDDGVPLNDAFGGWVYWPRPASCDRTDRSSPRRRIGTVRKQRDGRRAAVLPETRRRVPRRCRGWESEYG